MAVPTALYKIVYEPATSESVAFIMPNKALKVQDLMKYVSTIEEVEAQTGLSFLSMVPDEQRMIIKRAKATVTWQ